MKLSLLAILTMLSIQSFADAGFSIRRKKKTCIIKLSGTENLKTGKLIYFSGFYYNDTADKRPLVERGQLVKPGFEEWIQNGGRRWDESDRNIRFILVDPATGVITDSLLLFAKNYNLNIKISGENAGKLQYRIDSTKAVYEYVLKNREDDPMSYGTNRLVFIACSAIGFLLLAGLYMRNRKKMINQLA